MGDLHLESIIFMAVVWAGILATIGVSLYTLLKKKK